MYVSKKQYIYAYVHVCSFYMFYIKKFQAAPCNTFLGLSPALILAKKNSGHPPFLTHHPPLP